MSDSIASRIVEILAEKYDIPAEELSPATEFDLMGFDSLVLTELAIILEREYRVPVDADELANTDTIAEAAALVGARAVAA